MAKCDICREPLGQGRVVIAGRWYCSDCAYRYDYGDEAAERYRRPPPAPAWKTLALFESAAYVERKER